jgi:hypothetical protein
MHGFEALPKLNAGPQLAAGGQGHHIHEHVLRKGVIKIMDTILA